MAGPTVVGHPGYRKALIELSVYVNAAVTAYDLVRESVILHSPDLRVVYGVYDFETLRVHAEPDACDRGALHVAKPFDDAPRHAEQFTELVKHLAERVVALQLAS